MMDAQRSRDYPLHRREVTARLLEDRGDMAVIAGLGACAWDITAIGDHDLNFPLWGAMGGAVSMGLGLALAQPDRRVLVITGDGEMLMGVGSLATVAVQAPENLSIVVMDNEHFGETGMQTTHTAADVNLAEVANSMGVKNTATVSDEASLADRLPAIRHEPGPVFTVIKINAENLDFTLPPKDGAYLKDRFRIAVLGKGPATL